jgi:hypothetical protein
MGLLDSSRTFVRPIFRALYERDQTGVTWLPKLLSLANRCPPGLDLGVVQQPPSFEFPAKSPSDFLAWLVMHPADLSWPKNYEIKSEKAREKRQKLLAGDAAVRQEFLEAIRTPPKERIKWWLLEGSSKIDCALFTKRAVVFIEGKRTERSASAEISWYPYRNQLLRNLDCARWCAHQRSCDYYSLLVTTKDRLRIGDRAVKEEIVSASLPHLVESGTSAEVLSHFLGAATWIDIVTELDLPPTMLE